MVLGEPQILGQMKQAVRAAEAAGTLGLRAEPAFPAHVRGRQGRAHDTDIGSASVSMAAAAVKLAERSSRSCPSSVLLVGAGEMIELAATHFAAQASAVGHRREPHARTRRSSSREALRRGAITLNELPEQLAAVRHHRHVHGEHAADHRQGSGGKRVVRTRRHAPVLIVDLGVPRDVETEVGRSDDVFLYSVDDLGNSRAGRHRSLRSVR